MTSKISITDQIGCIDREIGIRERVYPRWILNKKMTRDQAELEMDRIRAVRETLIKSSAILADREPGTLETGEAWGPAKVRQLERERILGVLAKLLDNDGYYKVVAHLQRTNVKADGPT